jgi:hypothetical protein
MADKILENTVPVGETSNKLVRYNIITGEFIHRNKATRSQSWVTVNNKEVIKKYTAKFEDSVNLQLGLKGKVGDISSGPLVLAGPEGGKYARYPVGLKYGKDTDYVLFQFVEYQPPFAKTTVGSNTPSRTTGQLGQYNASVSEANVKIVYPKVKVGEEETEVLGVLLPIPQDLSTEQKQNWNGKKFTRIGANAIAATNGNFSNLADTIGDPGGNLKAILDALKTSALNKIPGVGGNLTINDIAGSTKGVVLNPNAELLYDSPDLREIGMVFKMVPQNDDEAKHIKLICDAFRTASLPAYGADDNVVTGLGGSGSNYIRVPNLCKFTFMSGSNPHKWVAQYKPCAITAVQVNYTPDGTFATYGDKSPVATELTIKFVETKLIFASEIGKGF